ncbi:protein draper isoform X4 [Drosophila sulfurigaster albostrigata]|uniref:protein draper isoform X4 n=1 Tax=Drosophila sulfurigaster albostrigata TaxID=89887 RepID=UPI002D21978B|nr:protein draper isoform X4 [Drosophila sulfurigaster albostrigata]
MHNCEMSRLSLKLALQLLALQLLLMMVHTEIIDQSIDEPEGLNVCKKRENYNVEVVITELQSFQERGSTWCLNIPPSCPTYRIKHRVVNKTQTLTKARIVRDCCDGYVRQGNQCVPHCSQPCQHGECVAPEKCKCTEGYGGPVCNIICRCLNNSSCDSDTGNCICAPGWTGVDCAEPCPDGFYGLECKERCQKSTHGNTTCDHITGEVICRPGYLGLTCEHACPQGLYGPSCKLKCNCEHQGECNPENGQCTCLPGWTGANCNQSCPQDTYGAGCSQHCRCQNHRSCRKNDGRCICLPGWMGDNCGSICPEGLYGDYCMHSCDCPSSNFQCHAAQGCVCRRGYTGENCDELIASQRVAESVQESSNAGVALSLVLLTIFMAIICAVFLYYRRRVSNLKTEIAHVHYTHETNGGGWPPANHNFDNPVYGMHPETSLLPSHLRPKMNNFNQNGSLTADYGDDSNASSRVGSYSINYNHELLNKNLNADLTNPNVYNAIGDSLKEEHVYDEIKQKEGYKDPVKIYSKILFLGDEYDHLDYSRPSTSQKPHYHRMNDTQLNINHDEEKPSNVKNMTVLLQKKPEPPTEPEPQHESFDNTNLDAASTASPSSSPELK